MGDVATWDAATGTIVPPEGWCAVDDMLTRTAMTAAEHGHTVEGEQRMSRHTMTTHIICSIYVPYDMELGSPGGNPEV